MNGKCDIPHDVQMFSLLYPGQWQPADLWLLLQPGPELKTQKYQQVVDQMARRR